MSYGIKNKKNKQINSSSKVDVIKMNTLEFMIFKHIKNL